MSLLKYLVLSTVILVLIIHPSVVKIDFMIGKIANE